ncbi:hypothetical protein C8J56DRAFT_883512 [Mycena floridula]|nr:hypothetical protein C8J56DRAFT_883512 [Mycena floridula]
MLPQVSKPDLFPCEQFEEVGSANIRWPGDEENRVRFAVHAEKEREEIHHILILETTDNITLCSMLRLQGYRTKGVEYDFKRLSVKTHQLRMGRHELHGLQQCRNIYSSLGGF